MIRTILFTLSLVVSTSAFAGEPPPAAPAGPVVTTTTTTVTPPTPAPVPTVVTPPAPTAWDTAPVDHAKKADAAAALECRPEDPVDACELIKRLAALEDRGTTVIKTPRIDELERWKADMIIWRHDVEKWMSEHGNQPGPAAQASVDLSALIVRIEKLETQVNDHELRIRALENAPPPVVPEPPKELLHLGGAVGLYITGQEPVPDMAGNVMYHLDPSLHLRLGDAFGSPYLEGQGGAVLGYWRATGFNTRLQAGYTFEVGVSIAALAGYTNYGIWADKELRCCDVAYKGFDAGIAIGYRPSEVVHLNLSITGQPVSHMEIAGNARDFGTHGQLTGGLEVVVFPRLRAQEERTARVSETEAPKTKGRKGRPDYGSGTTVEIISSPTDPQPQPEPDLISVPTDWLSVPVEETPPAPAPSPEAPPEPQP